MNYDDKIAEKLGKFHFWKYIHPNEITIFGIILNFVIGYILINKVKYFIPFIGILLLFRCLADIMDGYVARKYKKTSKIGNLLDTFSDLMLTFGYGFIFLKYCLKFNNYIIIGILSIILIILHYKFNFFNNHEKIKNGKKDIIENILNFITNNTIIIYIILFVFSIYIKNKGT